MAMDPFYAIVSDVLSETKSIKCHISTIFLVCDI